MKIGSLFSGYGGLDLAAAPFFGAETVWVSDIDPGACKILAHRYPDVPNLGDITKINWADVEPVDILTGGFPCQDLSHAGKRAGMHDGTRSGLWSHMAAAIEQLRPRYVVAENVRGLLSASATSDLEPCPWCLGGAADGEPALRALGCVLGDLAELGYDTRWCGLRAVDVGAPHGRFRVFIVAQDSNRYREASRSTGTISELRTRSTLRSHRSNSRDALADPRGERHGRPTMGRGAGSLGCLDGEAPSQARERERPREEPGCRGAAIAWGAYEPAIRRWERVLGRTAPAPTEASSRGAQRLSPNFVQWMMGLPAGHVTDVPGLSRNEQLKALGNGVVPQQAYAALSLMAERSEVTA